MNNNKLYSNSVPYAVMLTLTHVCYNTQSEAGTFMLMLKYITYFTRLCIGRGEGIIGTHMDKGLVEMPTSIFSVLSRKVITMYRYYMRYHDDIVQALDVVRIIYRHDIGLHDSII